MLLLALLTQAALPAPLPPLHGGLAPMICPVGGEVFQAWQPAVWSTFGNRPDGKPYGDLPMPFPLPECPTNKLVGFDHFSDAETARLKDLIATSEYRRIRAAETIYYRASWLADRIGRPKAEALFLLLKATWEVSRGGSVSADGAADRDRASRYQQAFVAGVKGLPANLPPRDRGWARARAANAQRQLGRFDEAELMRQAALSGLAGAEDEEGWRKFLAALGPVIGRHDASVEPLDMIPITRAAIRCEGDAREAFARAFCARPEVVQITSRLRG